MSIPYMPLYVTDYEGDTGHLTLEEDGAYNRLLRLCWRTSGCSLPNDPIWIARKMRVDAKTFDRLVAPLITEFFKRRRGRIYSPKQTRIFAGIKTTSLKRSSAGKKGGRPTNPLKTEHINKSPAKAKRKQPEPEPYREERATKVAPKKGTRLSENWVLPEEYREWAFSDGWEDAQIDLEADKFRDYWISKAGHTATKIKWLATWRNWLRNSHSPKTGGRNGTDNRTGKQSGWLEAFVGSPAMDQGQDSDPSEPLLPTERRSAIS